MKATKKPIVDNFQIDQFENQFKLCTSLLIVEQYFTNIDNKIQVTSLTFTLVVVIWGRSL